MDAKHFILMNLIKCVLKTVFLLLIKMICYHYIKFEVDIETGLRFVTEEQLYDDYARLHRVKDLRWLSKAISISK